MASSSPVSPLQRIEITLFYLVLFSGTLLICWESRLYYLPNTVHSFLLERMELTLEDWWRYTLLTHVTGGLICLVSSLSQYSRLFLKRAPWLHRNLGRIYALSIIMVVFPTGVALSFVAKGGLSGTLGFLVLSFGTLFTLLLGLVAIYRKNLRAHQTWISRSFALVTTAITFRSLQLALFQFDIDYQTIYQIALWGSIGINVVLCEYYLLRTTKQKK